MTPLDTAHAAMEADPEDEALRRQFYGLLAASELFLVLEAEAENDTARPLLLGTEEGQVALVFDTEERLAGFSDQPVPYLALSGRRVVTMLAGSGVSLGFNLVGAPSAIVLPPDVLDWIGETIAGEVSADALPEQIFAPRQASERFLVSLDERLATLTGLAEKAYLVGAGAGTELMLGLTGVPDAAQDQVLRVLAEVRNFTAPDQELSIGFIAAGSGAEAKLAATGLRFDIPVPEASPAPIRPAPGSDPEKPPRLR